MEGLTDQLTPVFVRPFSHHTMRVPMIDNEQEVIAHAQKDPEAFGRLYDEYYQPIFGFMYSRTRNAEVAKDLTSETFFQALKNIGRYRPRKGASFKSWLFAIAVAQIGNYYRGRKKMFEVTTEDAPEIVARDEFRPDIAYRMGEDADALKLRIEQVCRLLKRLNQKQQDVITLRFFSKLTIPEISKILKMKEGTIKSHIHRAIKRLNVLMLDEEALGDAEQVVIVSEKKYAKQTV
jgi:RNA polymerase sigma-70 factor, ECF subfamily